MDDYDEIERLRTWYEYFEKSYKAMEIEIERRRVFELELNKKVEAFRVFLKKEIA